MFVLHGEDLKSSRNEFIRLKSQASASGKQVVDLEGFSITLNELVTASSSISLLGSDNVVFVENLFSRRPSNEKKALIEYLLSHPDLSITIWETKDVGAQLKSFPTKSYKNFELPKYIFQFIDTFSPDLYLKSLASSEPEQLLGLIAKRLHDLILVKENKLSLPSWQLSKIENQAKRFSLLQLIDLNTELLNLDYKLKNSHLPFDLAAGLEFWLTKLNNNFNK